MAYPDTAGYKVEGTSQEAANSTDAETLRELVLEQLLKGEELTADELAETLSIDRLAIRPRCSELRLYGLIEDSGERRLNISGKRAIVWRLAQNLQ